MNSKTAASPRRRYHSDVRAAAAAETVDRILETAIRLFSTELYDAVSLETIATEAGVAVRTLIRRFGSKEALFTAADREAGRRMLAQRDQAPVGDPPGAIRNVLEHYETWGDQRLLMIAQEKRIAAVRRHVEEGRGLHRRWVERTFAPSLEHLSPKQRERRVLALVVATDVYVWKLLRRDLGLSEAETQRVIETLVGTPGKGEP